jgi:hypothetical protein
MLLVGSVAPAASATSLMSQINTEGELDVGLGCLDAAQCLDAAGLPYISSITSLVDSTTGTKSRLFIDNLNTANEYDENTFLEERDAGTNHVGWWFRPSEYEENGQLEVGTFQFDFSTVLSSLTVDFFDIESKETGILAINGESLASPDFVTWAESGFADGNIVSQTFTDISSITLKLGRDVDNGTGDGVNFRFSEIVAAAPEDVPEPATVLGLLGVGAIAAVSHRKQQGQA